MAKSSIHLQGSKGGSIGHNSRENFSHSVVFLDEKNECTSNQKEAYSLLRSELQKRSASYTQRTGQKLQKIAVIQLSAVLNLEQHHTLKDLDPIKKHLEKTFGTKVVQMAIHRDEGKLISKKDSTELYSGKNFFLNNEDNKLYFDKKYTKIVPMSEYEVQKNYHAHIEMLGLDDKGQAIRQKMNKVALQELQTITAKSLKMERGKENTSYTKEQMQEIIAITGKKSDYESTTLYAQKFNEVSKDLGFFIEKTKRKDTHVFKELGAEREENKRAILANQDDLKREVAKLREELKASGAIREDYAKLEALNKELKERIKIKDLTIQRLEDYLQELQNEPPQKVIKEKIVKIEDTTRIQELEKQLSEALQSKKEFDAIKDTQKDQVVDLKPLFDPKIALQTVEVKTGILRSEKREILPYKEADKLINYANAVLKQNRELHIQYEMIKRENSKLLEFKKAYTDIVAKLKEYTKFDKLGEAIGAIKQHFIKSPVQEIEKSIKEEEENKHEEFFSLKNETPRKVRKNRP